jgi:hypothetical protein
MTTEVFLGIMMYCYMIMIPLKKFIVIFWICDMNKSMATSLYKSPWPPCGAALFTCELLHQQLSKLACEGGPCIDVTVDCFGGSLWGGSLMHCRRIKEACIFCIWWVRLKKEICWWYLWSVWCTLWMAYIVNGWNRMLLVGLLPLALGPASIVATARALRGQACRANLWPCSNT